MHTRNKPTDQRKTVVATFACTYSLVLGAFVVEMEHLQCIHYKRAFPLTAFFKVETHLQVNRVRRFRHNWDTDETVKVPDSCVQLLNEFAAQRMKRFQHTAGQSRQFTVEEVQAFSPFESNDISVEELKASVKLEGEDPQDVLQFINLVPTVELPEEQTALNQPVDDQTTAGVNAEPKVETIDADVEMTDSYTGGTDDVPGPDTNPAGVNALPTAPEPDQHMAKIEANVLEVLADEPMATEESNQPVAGTSSSSASKPPLPRLRGKGQGQGTPAAAPVTGSFLEPDDDVDLNLKYSGKGKGALVREIMAQPRVQEYES